MSHKKVHQWVLGSLNNLYLPQAGDSVLDFEVFRDFFFKNLDSVKFAQ